MYTTAAANYIAPKLTEKYLINTCRLFLSISEKLWLKVKDQTIKTPNYLVGDKVDQKLC